MSRGQNTRSYSQKWLKLCITIFINYFCIPEVCQMLEDTTINDKNNTKVIAKLHQGYFKVKIAKKLKVSTFYQIQHG